MKIFNLTLLCLPLLCGCVSNTKVGSNAPTPQEQLCAELRSNLIFNTTETSPVVTASATQRADMMRLYHKNNCDKLKK